LDPCSAAMEKSASAAALCFLSLCLLAGTALGYQCETHSYYNLSTLTCSNLDDGDLPLAYNSKYAGHYARFEIGNSSSLTVIPANAFGDSISFDKFLLPDLESLAEIKSGFLGSKASTVQQIMIVSSPLFKLFPWTDLSQTTSLKEFVISNTGLSAVPSGIQWPANISSIDLSYNSALEEILPFTFKTARNLEKLKMWSSSAKIVFRQNALYTTSRNNATFEFYFTGEETSDAKHVMFEDNAFGDVDGGELWDTISVNISEFRENTFRLMLKSKFDKQADHFFVQKFGIIHIKDCMSDCSAAWLYKDAVMFGMKEYKTILGGLDNVPVVCDGYGPLLVGPKDNQDLKAHFDKCPATPMPWPGKYCKDVYGDNDIVADPENCHCYFLCDNQEVHGHVCCAPGLAFNPKLAACDWAYNVPDCS